MRRPLPRTVWILGIVSLLMDLSSEIYHALLPAFLTVTLGLPVAAMGALDGAAEGAAQFSKLASGPLSDRSQRRKPWVLLGYGLAALSKPLFPLAQGVLAVLGARLVDRVGKGIRGAPRDAMIADETPPEDRGRAFGLRQSLDTVGGFIGPLAAVAMMWWLAGDIRTIFWIAAIPAFLSFLFAAAMLREPARKAAQAVKLRWGGLGDLAPAVKKLLLLGLLFGLARFSESFLILRAMDVGLDPIYSPVVLALFAVSFFLFAYPAGAWSDRVAPTRVLAVGIVLLVTADLVLAFAEALPMVLVGTAIWGAHMAFTQGILSRMVADAAPEGHRATSFGAFFFVGGIAALFASLAAGLIWDRFGAPATFFAGAGMALVAGLWLAASRRVVA
ncbi:MFS transporter [Sphingomicrobium nitratireducens]|uniref:MFS transporter n=1 Tax=Sphingomicrobium nitratireducens TaxID=2964666 RepID=UPI00223FAF0E|nr:MFS transporter [Sphingomicrobium nitratireducens]